ncbi:MAG TPA: TonB-dependent receptor, partial [Acidobacteriota bacterium]
MTDRSGAVVPGVSVVVKNKATGFERVVVSEDNGYFRVPSLQAGKYSLTAELSGFSKFVIEETIVNVGTSTNVKVTLEPAGTQEVVTVSGAAPLVDVSKTDVGGIVDNRAVENQPLNGRNFSSLALMIPGVRPVTSWDPTKTRIGAISIAGAGGRNINTTVDGIDNKDNTVGGYVQNVTIEAIQEFALKTQRFSAADGRSQGGLLSIVSKTGSNSLHGSFFSFFRNDKLNANDYFSEKQGAPKPDFSRKQFGGSIGGPIVKEKVFFFFAIERLNEDQSTIISPQTFKELSALKAANISIYGASPGPTQTLPTPFRNTLTSARLDFAFNERNNAYLAWHENRDNTLNDQGPTDLTSTNFNKNKNEIFSFVLNSILSPTKLNQVTAGYSYWNNLIDTDQKTPVTVYFADVSFGTNTNVPQQSYQKKWQLKDAFNWTAGNHGWKFGLDYVFEPKLGGFFGFTPVPAITFFDNPTVILSDKAKYPQGFATPGIVQGIQSTAGDPRFDVKDKIHMIGWYVQDDWKVTRKLTLNLGVRYDADINLLGAGNQTQNRTYQILKKINSPITNGWINGVPGNDLNNFAPRVGFAYDPNGDGKTVIRGGYGIYFDQPFLNIPLFAIQHANPT